METRVDYAARPDFGAHVDRLGEAELRRLLRVACPGVPVPGSRTETAELLMTREAAQTAVSAATPDVLSVVKLVHVLEDTAAVDDVAAVAVWGSEADAMPHDGDGPPSSARVPATEAEVTRLLRSAADLGLAWEEPAGVWNVPPHVSEVIVQDPTMATPVECLLEFNPRDELLSRMHAIGLLDAAEVTDPPSDDDVLARLRAFLCSPRRVRALVSTAPHAIQKSLLLFAREGIFLDGRQWGDRRADAVEWAVEHLLAVTFDVPGAPNGGDSAGDAAGEAAGDSAGDSSGDPAEDDESAESDDAAAPNLDVNASLVSPVALALKLGRQWIPTPHPEEPRPAWIDAEAPVQAATSAVAVATAVMQLWEDGGYLAEDGSLQYFEGAVAVQDFAASIGADDAVVHEVVGMLAGAGFIHPGSGQPTARSATRWFAADASRRWAWLVAGWLRGPDRWVADESPESWMPSAELMAHVAKRVRREAVQFAAELDEGMMWYPCCVESRLAWRCSALFDGLEELWGMLLHRIGQGMRVLGLMVEGAAGMPAAAVSAALAPAWFSGQDPTVDEAVDLIAAETGDFVPVARRAQLLTPPSLLVADRVELVAMVRGVPGHDLAVTLNSVAHREKCGATSLWVFTEDSLAVALDDYDYDVPAILEAVGHVTTAGPWLRVLRHRLRGVEEALDLEEMLPDVDVDPVPAPDAIDGAETARAAEVEDDTANDAANDGADGLFEVVAVDAEEVAPNGVVEPPLFDIPGQSNVELRPARSAMADGDVDGDADGDTDGDANSAGDQPGAEALDGPAGSSGPRTGEPPIIEDPLRRPDSGTGPGVPTQPPLF
ncbi:hypothetical protein [uncultured Corynebacterium sp.]|uniref:hypothetical protein n=1 Tax=uncultured Corynebacterium sp. TaxID=159447 RepID=UPI0025DDAE71|nr:hypothetical protein [uncultured Corynebacterium sp.]